MHQFFFGPSESQLLGSFHPPVKPARESWGVVFCQPLAHEFYNAHRCSVQLATALSEAGLAVLRFDYFGTADSPGDWEDASITRWVDDIGCAAAELRRRGIGRVCLAGFRFGATLAALYAAQRGPLDALVLWEPLASGQQYLKELVALHTEMLHQDKITSEVPDEGLAGFRYGGSLRAEIARIDLRAGEGTLAHNLLLIQSQEQAGEDPRTLLRADRIEVEAVPTPRFWFPHPRQTPLPPEIPVRILNWIGGL